MRRAGNRWRGPSLLGSLLLWLAGCSSAPVPEPYYNRGVTHMQQEQPAEALSELSQALAIDPDDDMAAHRYGLALAREGRYDEAQRQIRHATRLRPREPRYWLDLGIVSHNAGLVTEATRALDRARQLDPSDPRPLFYQGLIRIDEGDAVGARTHFEAALDIDPLFEPAQRWLAALAREETPDDDAATVRQP